MHNSTQDSITTQFKINDLGEGVVIWRERSGSIYNVLAKRVSQNSWHAVESLETYAGPIESVYLDGNKNGAYVVAWIQRHSEGVSLFSTHYQSSTAWSEPEQLDLGANQIVYANLDISDNGKMSAAWAQGDSGQLQINTNRFQAAAPYYQVKTTDTWASLAQTLYGSNTVADELQMALAQPALTVDLQLNNLPATLENTNTPPSAINDEAITNQDTSIILNVLANDSDTESDPIVITSVTQPINGQVSISSDQQTIVYTPNTAYVGRDDISYQINDGKAGSAQANIAIAVAGTDTDIDADGVLDLNDAFPLDPNESADFDADGTGDNSDPDQDNDGVDNASDQCPSTPISEVVDAVGCPVVLFDADNDGVTDALDICPNTPANEVVDANGCSVTQLDSDNDGVSDAADSCPNTPANDVVNANGCAATQLDSDNDGVNNALDQCPNTLIGLDVDSNGCPLSSAEDSDGDGVADNSDNCQHIYNPNQIDANANNIGDLCETVGSIQMTSPQAQQVITTNHTLVTGTFSGPINSGVTINGQTACLSGNTFYANNVPLVWGDNTLLAKLNVPVGAGNQQAINVNRNGDSLFQFEAELYCGMAPFEANFTLTNLGNDFESIDIDYGTDDCANLSAAEPQTVIQCTYTQAGTYSVTAQIRDAQANVYSQQLTLVVQAQTEIQTTLNASWSDLKTALTTNDPDTAASHISAEARAVYGPIFQALGDDMPNIIDGWTEMVPISMNGNRAEYAVLRVLNNKTNVFIIQFAKDGNGVWRIVSM